MQVINANDITIRTALKTGDLGYVAYMHGDIYGRELGYGFNFERYVLEGLLEFSRQYDTAKDRVWICEYNGRMVGFLMALSRGKTVQLRYFIIDPAFRGYGLGKRLMDHFMSFMDERGFDNAYLWTTNQQDTAVSLYARHGFVLTEEKDSQAFDIPLTEKRYDLFRTPNPLLEVYDTPYGLPPFERIVPARYLPAFEAAMQEHRANINKITTLTTPPSFADTMEAFEKSGKLLRSVNAVFANLTSANTSAELENISRQLAPVLAKHSDDIYLDATLFNRIKALYEKQGTLQLTGEQAKLLEKTYKDFVRSGANLDAASQERLREINKQLSLLTVRFGQHLLAETNHYELMVTDEKDLAGLHASLIEAAALSAKAAGKSGGWRFTLHNASVMPFLQYADNRALREEIYTAYVNRCNHNDDRDNKAIVTQLAALRAEKAALLGYTSHADYILEENMAKTPAKANELLQQLWKAALPVATQEAAAMQAIMDREGNNDKLAAWDWFYYADKVRKEKYSYDAEALRPYFKLENVRDGLFFTAKQLYGLNFQLLEGVPVYHEEVSAYEVTGADGQLVGLLYLDFHPRSSKRGGAWMTSYRKQAVNEQGRVAPIISIVCNFSRPTATQPALLTPDEAETFFHEAGHALHGLLSDVTYETLSGTAVPRDFVELPSQVMEHWAFEPEVLAQYARHYETGELIPPALVDKMKAASKFNQGFATVEYLAASLLDMAYHTLPAGNNVAPLEFEKEQMDRIGLLPEIAPRYRSTYFQHIFSGGYSAGYYSYIWSEVLDSDAFAAFKEAGNIFDAATATAFRKNILEKGGTEEPMVLYKAFRKREPDVKYLLQHRGLE
ncbi:GNAT family N-acetyltransferase [Chitinophaga rhizophila]|uniref:GNAT family N-acetyltransferase n=1 Tax=Chitinophaga rhizophila TaxID=2866212 RepID=A0ABS7GBP4_9BACT|nr:GNAT family N-acetyltransferase [Chitinophaga rhizophila]MBW8684545.1 GNAT family N-acetyltransferase [Chitinophaga rhizophila]